MLPVLLSLRYLMLVPAAVMVAGSLVMFGLAAVKLAHAADGLVTGTGSAGEITASAMGAADASLFGIVLIIFACAISFGFAIDLRPEARRRLPEWMRPNGIGELKHTLVEVILVFLIVDFATDFASGPPMTWETIIKPASILLLAGALCLMGWNHVSKPQAAAEGAAGDERH